MPKPTSPAPNTTLAGWQGVTVEIPEGWELGAITAEPTGGYMRWDDGEMPRLEVKWSQQSGYVDLARVIDKYLKDIEKQQRKSGGELIIEREVNLLKGKRKRAGLKCFRWSGTTVAYGAAWVCKDCGRTLIAQVHTPRETKPEAAQELASNVLLSITDHPTDGWGLWSAYGLACWVPEDYKPTSQKLMAGLIEFEFEFKTERIKVSRWGMAKLALKGRPLEDWLASEFHKVFRKNDVGEPEPLEVMGHEGLALTGGNLVGAQKIQRFWEHCRGRLFADRFRARAWHCPETNKLFYVETFVDRENADLIDEIVARLSCHTPEPVEGAEA